MPVIVIGGPHGHIPLEPGAGKIIANLVVDHPGWYVIDYSRFDHRADEIRFAADFGVQLYRRKQRKPSALHLFIDEADMFVPQKLPKNAKDMLDAYDAIVRRGGVYGLGVTLISQRPALVNTDVRTQCETLIALQTTAPLDQDPILDWVGRNGTDEQLREIKRTLASLKVGEAWFFSPDSDVFQKIQIRPRETFNSSATPKPGAKPIEPKVFANIDLQSLGEEIAATVERSKQEDPEYLRGRISQLQRELTSKQPVPVVAEPVVQQVEVPVITPDQLQALEGHVESIQRVTQEFREIRLEIEKLFNGKIDGLNTTALTLSTAIEAARKPSKPAPGARASVTAVTADPGKPKTVRQLNHAFLANQKLEKGDAGYIEEGLTGPEQRILDALAWMESIGVQNPNKSTIAFLSGYTNYRSKGFTNPLSSLSVSGLVQKPSRDTLALTNAGRGLAHDQDPPASTQELQAMIFSKLPGPHRRILSVLVERGEPFPMERDDLAARCGYTNARSKGFTNPLSWLKTARLIEKTVDDQFVAANLLFLE